MWLHPMAGVNARVGYGYEPFFLGTTVLLDGAVRPVALRLGSGEFLAEGYLGGGGIFGRQLECDAEGDCPPGARAAALVLEAELRAGYRWAMFQTHLIARLRFVDFEILESYLGLRIGLWFDFEE